MIGGANASRRGSAPESATVSTLRQRNRAQALKGIILAGQTTRAEIARECGLSAASATNLVTELVAEGLVAETGSVASRGGRPIGLIEPRPEGAYFIGADVGERGVAVELFDLSMRMIDREFRGGRDQERPETITEDLSQALAALQGRNSEPWQRLAGVGLALPGIVETTADGEQLLYAQSLGWPPLLVSELIRSDMPVLAENGAKTQAKAELWFGAARGIEHALVVLLGRGVGLGIVSGGELLHGASSSAGEWGHSKIERGGRRCRCGGYGCVEAYVGADAIFSDWAAAGGSFTGSGWGALGELIAASERGDAAAAGVVDGIIGTLGPALGGLVNLSNPQLVVIGGWVGLRLMESLAPRLETAIRDNSLMHPGAQFALRPASFGGDTVALGAAIMPLEALIHEPRG